MGIIDTIGNWLLIWFCLIVWLVVSVRILRGALPTWGLFGHFRRGKMSVLWKIFAVVVAPIAIVLVSAVDACERFYPWKVK